MVADDENWFRKSWSNRQQPHRQTQCAKQINSIKISKFPSVVLAILKAVYWRHIFIKSSGWFYLCHWKKKNHNWALMTMEQFSRCKKTLLQVIPNCCAQNWMMMPCGISKYINENLNWRAFFKAAAHHVTNLWLRFSTFSSLEKWNLEHIDIPSCIANLVFD